MAEVKKDIVIYPRGFGPDAGLVPLVFVEVFDPVINWGRRSAHFLSEDGCWCKCERIVSIVGMRGCALIISDTSAISVLSASWVGFEVPSLRDIESRIFLLHQTSPPGNHPCWMRGVG